METRKFTAETMREALELVRLAYGDEAVILGAQTMTTPDTPGTYVEVWAQASTDTAVAVPTPPETPAATETATSVQASAQYVQALQTRIHSMHEQLEALPADMPWLESALPVLDDAGRERLARSAQLLAYSGGIQREDRPHVVAVIGPNGVGKTTMLARLAWHYAIEEQLPVAIVSTDTQRVGAMEQWRLYCEHMDVPLAFAYRPEQVRAAVRQWSTQALILLDTPGGSPRDGDYLPALRDCLAAADPSEVHLALGADTSPAAIRETFERYRPLEPDQLWLTRLDLAACWPDILPLLSEIHLPLGYLSIGPRVPDDWRVASATEFLAFGTIMGGK